MLLKNYFFPGRFDKRLSENGSSLESANEYYRNIPSQGISSRESYSEVFMEDTSIIEYRTKIEEDGNFSDDSLFYSCGK